ncbi:uncharacterized protein LOC113290870 [Papaver somniferum]|uniref:uncharacterized protein LOC113290870 n=1 Tax=Papaver somniferum TaxID=3469 RepID=UPI000E6FC231|nr:uncharacterized protein LOC113290870 [Papaver somniferum]
MAAVSCIVVVRYFEDFITTRVDVETTLDEFKDQFCKQWKQFTPFGICFFFQEASSSSSRSSSSITNGSSTSSRNTQSLGMYLEDKSKPAKPLLSDGWLRSLVRAYNPEHTCGVGGRNLNQKYSTSFTSSLIEKEAYNGREKVYKSIYGDDVKSYSHLVWYMNAIMETNPCSVIDFEFYPAKKQFQWIFILFAACIQGYRCCQLMVYLDATFLTGIFRGCLIAATWINGDHGFFPLAIALVDAENNNNWEWFLRNLTQNNLPITGSDPRYTLMFDHFQEATYALSPENHAKAIQKITYLNCDWVDDYIDDIPPESYMNAYFKGYRCGRTTSTSGGSFNSWILIRMKVMVMMTDHHDDDAKMMTPLTLECKKNLEALQDEGLYWKVGIYCFPCDHALASIRKIKHQAIDFVPSYLTSNYFRKTYVHCIQSIPNYNRPADIDEDHTINPPII